MERVAAPDVLPFHKFPLFLVGESSPFYCYLVLVKKPETQFLHRCVHQRSTMSEPLLCFEVNLLSGRKLQDVVT